MMKRKRKPQTNTVMIDRALYQALEAQEQVAARQHAEIERLRSACRAGGDPEKGGGVTDGPYLLEKAAQILEQHDYATYLVHCLRRKAQIERDALAALPTV